MIWILAKQIIQRIRIDRDTLNLTFSAFALSKSPLSMILWSGLRRESVGATPSSISLREHTKSGSPYAASRPALKIVQGEGGSEGGRGEEGGREKEGREEGREGGGWREKGREGEGGREQ